MVWQPHAAYQEKKKSSRTKYAKSIKRSCSKHLKEEGRDAKLQEGNLKVSHKQLHVCTYILKLHWEQST